jgi:hypothetical protein
MGKKNTKNVAMPGSFFRYQDFAVVHGKVIRVITENRRKSTSSFFTKGFSIILVDEGRGKSEEGGAAERVMIIASDNDKIPPATITGDNDIEGKTVTITSNEIIIQD